MAQYNADEVRRRLTGERERLEHDIWERTQGPEGVVPVDPILGSGGVSSHEADDADAVSDYDRNQAVVRNSQDLLAQINAALERLDAGTYGTCQRCGKEIGARRLEAVPYAVLCIDCQEALEREHPNM